MKLHMIGLIHKQPEELVFGCVGLPQNFCLHSRLASRQWSLAPDKNFKAPPCQIPNSSSCLCIHGSVKSVSKERLREVASLELDGVSEADFVVVLLPGGNGTHLELGLHLQR